MRYSAHSQEAERAETAGAAGSGEYSGHQLSHLEAVDLSRKNQIGENAGRTPPRAGERDRPVVSEKTWAWRYRDPAGKSAEDQRTKPVDRARAGSEVQRPAGASEAGFRGAADHGDYYGGCREGDAAEARGARGGADQIDGSDDFKSVTGAVTREWWQEKVAQVVPRIPAHHFRFPRAARGASSGARNSHSRGGGLEICDGRDGGKV